MPIITKQRLTVIRMTNRKHTCRFLLVLPSRLEHSSFRPVRHYWHRYIQKTTQECTFWSCLPLTTELLALLDVSYRGLAAPYKFHVDWLIEVAHVRLNWQLCTYLNLFSQKYSLFVSVLWVGTNCRPICVKASWEIKFTKTVTVHKVRKLLGRWFNCCNLNLPCRAIKVQALSEAANERSVCLSLAVSCVLELSYGYFETVKTNRN